MSDNGSSATPAGEQAIGSSGREAVSVDPCAMVIFGAGGDLTKRLVAPALYDLSCTGALPDHFVLIGVDLAAGTAESWRNHPVMFAHGHHGCPRSKVMVNDSPAWLHLPVSLPPARVPSKTAFNHFHSRRTFGGVA